MTLNKIGNFVCLSVPFQGHVKVIKKHLKFVWPSHNSQNILITFPNYQYFVMTLIKIWKFVSIRPILMSCQVHHKSHLLVLPWHHSQNIFIKFTNYQYFVKTLTWSCQGYHNSPLVYVTLKQFTEHFDGFHKFPGLYNDLDQICKFVYLSVAFSRSCQGQQNLKCINEKRLKQMLTSQ